MQRWLICIVITFSCFVVGQAGASQQRFALVIGNSTYQVGALKNPARDASLMARTLREVGFEVMEEIDADERAMGRAMVKFSRKVEEAGKDAIALFYYAGHGIQYRGENYLIPVGARIEDEVDIDLEAVRAGTLLRQLERAGARLNIVILDACRNNPFQASTRSVDRGLARMDAPNGTLLAYSTAPGRVATDGTGRNSPYTNALARAIKEPGVPIEQVFKRVRIAVMDQTGDDQVPWESSSLTGEFSFVEQGPQTASLGADETVEIELWKSISLMETPKVFQDYLDQYPNGLFASVAQQKLAALNSQPAEPVSTDDLQFYQSIQGSDDAVQFEAYLKRFPDGLFADIAKARIESLNQNAIEKKARAALEEQRVLWNSISTSTDPAMFESFLKNFPDGVFSDLAAARLSSLQSPPQSSAASEVTQMEPEIMFWESIKTSTNKADYQAYLDQFPEGTFSSIARDRAQNGYAGQTAALTNQSQPQDGLYRLQIYVVSSSGGPSRTQLNNPGETIDVEIPVTSGAYSGSVTSNAYSTVDIKLKIRETGDFQMAYGWGGAYPVARKFAGSLDNGRFEKVLQTGGHILRWKIIKQ